MFGFSFTPFPSIVFVNFHLFCERVAAAMERLLTLLSEKKADIGWSDKKEVYTLLAVYTSFCVNKRNIYFRVCTATEVYTLKCSECTLKYILLPTIWCDKKRVCTSEEKYILLKSEVWSRCDFFLFSKKRKVLSNAF